MLHASRWAEGLLLSSLLLGCTPASSSESATAVERELAASPPVEEKQGSRLATKAGPARVSHVDLTPELEPTAESKPEPTTEQPTTEHGIPKDLIKIRRFHGLEPEVLAIMIPPWRIAYEDWHEFRERYGWNPEAQRAAERKVLEEIDALPIGDPDYVEARCLMALPSVGGTAERLWLEALEELRRTPEPDPEQRFRHLDRRPLLVTELRWSTETLPQIEAHSLGIGSDPKWCADADEAFVRLELSGTYFSYAMVKGGLGLPTGTPSPSRKDGGRAATETFAALYDDVQDALGSKHRYMASLTELGALSCWDGHRRKYPRQCMKFDAAVRKALKIRSAVLPSDDAALRGSQLRVAALELERGRRAKARALLELATTDRLREEAHITAAALLGGLLVGDGEVDAGLRSLTRAANVADQELRDSGWTHRKTLEVARDFHAHAGRDEEARELGERAERID